MSEERTYFGTFILEKKGNFGFPMPGIGTIEQLKQFLQPEQLKWIDRHAPDFKFWRDEFRRSNYHMYVKRKLTANQLGLAALLFTNAAPTHTPLGEDALWKNSNIS